MLQMISWEMLQMIRLDLSKTIQGVGLIILSLDQVAFENQVGGHGRLTREEQGVFFPLRDYDPVLADHFISHDKWNGWCCDGIDEPTADFLDEHFKQPIMYPLTVDRDCLKKSCEAWVYVNVVVEDWHDCYGFISLNQDHNKGVLTWKNRD